MQFACGEIAIKQISSVVLQNVSRPFSAQYYCSWCKLRFSHLYSTPWLISSVIYKKNEASYRKSLFSINFCNVTLQPER